MEHHDQYHYCDAPILLFTAIKFRVNAIYPAVAVIRNIEYPAGYFVFGQAG